MLLGIRVEVAARTFEIGRVADRLRVNMYGVFAKGEVLQFELDGEFAFLALVEGCRAGILAGRGLDGNDQLVFLFSESGGNECQGGQSG